jgi:hypothetical protein
MDEEVCASTRSMDAPHSHSSRTSTATVRACWSSLAVVCEGGGGDTRFERRATLCSEIPHLVLDAEADPETNLAHATDFWLN